ncbi:MAG: isoprenylcysteine carboxylmethyltransferase family protein [Candidatus Melainabacteria bacterium]|jgi:protein-S-isoprenylcysteine O-methyltransferase Ste14|nr:isoprenylcysteine carboxylmethyltransferase family protein [Candidatus Melainabacteria bacterium]
MDNSTRIRFYTGIPTLLVVLGAPIFLAAWTFDYWQAWVFIAIFSLATMAHGLILWRLAPDVLARRIKAGPAAETRPVQKLIMLLITLAFLGFLVLCGLDHRFGWSHVPLPAVLFGDFLVALSFYVFTVVCLENRFASATIETHEGQSVVSTGMYGVVRHPMYAGALLLLVGIPLSLGSLWSALFITVAVGILIWRITDEEKFLLSHLNGYPEYCKKVKYRLIPGVY